MPDSSTRPIRICAACGGVDDHPHHAIGVPAVDGEPHPLAVPSPEFLASLADKAPATAVAQLMTPTQVSRHIDCCAAAGCTICQETEAITKGQRGQALIDVIGGGALADHEPTDGLSNKELGTDG